MSINFITMEKEFFKGIYLNFLFNGQHGVVEIETFLILQVFIFCYYVKISKNFMKTFVVQYFIK